MRNKKQKTEPESNPEHQLEERVDAMMDLRREEPQADVKLVDNTENELAELTATDPPAIDIFSETKTAPKLPGAEDMPLEPRQKPKKLTKEVQVQSTELAEAAIDEEVPEDLVIDEETDEVDTSLDASKSVDELSTDAAIDNIVKTDLDKVLEAEDAVAKKHVEKTPDSLKDKLRNFFRAWWRNKTARYTTVGVVLVVLGGLAVWPTSRYLVLNAAGVRSSASLKVVDRATDLPLKNVTVALGDGSAKTDENGEVKFTFLRLGTKELKIDRVAFAPVKKTVTVGWGSNPLGDLGLRATGAQYTFEVTDYLSNKPIKAEAVSDNASAYADKNGKIILAVEDPKSETLSVRITADEYRTETLTFAAETKDIFSVKVVPDQPVVYVTKQSGKYDVYKMDVDGKNKQLILEGTGRERQTMSVVASPDGTQAVVVSSRGTKRDKERYLLDTLTLINLKDASTAAIDDAQNIRLIDWQGKRLVYAATYAAPSAAIGNRQQIIAYNTESNARAVLANSDYFNGIMSSNGYVYYAIANSDPNQAASFSRIKFDGGNKQVLLNKQVWTVQRADSKRLSLQTPEGWYDYTLGAGTPSKGDPPAENYTERQYFFDASGDRHAWIEGRDGKGVLIVHEPNADKENVAVSASGVTGPVRWLSSTTLQYRVSNSNETAEYVKNIRGGEAKKLTDATPVAGFSLN